MHRRYFVQGATALTISQLLVGCSHNNTSKLTVKFLRNSLPGQVVEKFRQSLKSQAKLEFSLEGQLGDIFQQLQNWQEKKEPQAKQGWNLPLGQSEPQVADLVTVGDYWLKSAIEQKLIQPLDVSKLQNWSKLPPKWQNLVRRNEKGEIDSQGKIWGAPYRWGTTVIVYNREKLKSLGIQPQDWDDLWRKELGDRISLLDQPREVIGLTLKKLGKSYNTTKLSTVSNLETELKALHQQTKFYSSTRYLEPLLIGDTWLAVGWSNEVLPFINRYPQFTAFVPKSGTSLWADIWVKPGNPSAQEQKNLAATNLPDQWIDFCWSDNIAQTISLLTRANSPIPVSIDQKNISSALRNVLMADATTLNQSEFILPLAANVSQEYGEFFEKMQA